METTLKYERVILVREMGEKFKQVGKVFEVASILDGSFLLRDGQTRVAVGVVSFEDLDKYFVHEENFKGWTAWTTFVGFDGQSDAVYRTNGRRVQVEFLTDKVRAESCCHKDDVFNLPFGLRMAYLRCYNKAMRKRKEEFEETVKVLSHEIGENETIMKSMVDSLKD